MSAVVGGIAYSSAEQKCEWQQEQFRAIAEEECLTSDPQIILNVPKDATEQVYLERLRRANSLHAICSFAMSGVPHRASHAL